MVRTISLVLSLVACGKSGGGSASGGAAPAASSGSAAAPAAPAGNGAITGEWAGSWTRNGTLPGAPTPGELHLSVGANTTFKRVGTACPPEETPATVTVSGDTVKIDVATEEVKATYTGTRSGKEITGTLITSCKLGTGTGTFKLTAQ